MTNQKGSEIAKLHQQYILQSWGKAGGPVLPVEKAQGIYFWDYDGNKYADMSSLLVCSNLGHGLPEIVQAIQAQAETLCFMAPAYASEPKSTLAKMLVEAAGEDHFARVFFTNGGAESSQIVQLPEALQGEIPAGVYFTEAEGVRRILFPQIVDAPHLHADADSIHCKLGVALARRRCAARKRRK